MIIEWNTHIFHPDGKRYPFHPEAAYRPKVAAEPADPLAAYRERMVKEGIERAVLVHPEPYGDDHRLILDCLANDAPTAARMSIWTASTILGCGRCGRRRSSWG